MPGVDDLADSWFADADLDELRGAVLSRTTATEGDEDLWFLRQVLAVIDDGITERAAVGVCADTRGDEVVPIRPGAVVQLDASELSAGLHDAWIDFDSVANDGNSTRFEGYVERSRHRFRYEAFVVFSGFELLDEAQIGGTTVASVRTSDGGITLVGNIPGSLTFHAAQGGARIRVQAQPFAVRPWFRHWRDL